MFRRKLLVAAVAAGIALAMTGCGGGSGATGTKDNPTKITYLAWSNEKAVRPLVDAFEKANPDVKIDINTAEGSALGYTRLLTTRIAGNQMPDVFHMSTSIRNDVMKGGYAKDLTNEPFMKGINKLGNDMYSLNGKIYGMSTTAWAGFLIYNKDLLKKAGVPDKIPETLPEFLEFGKKIKAAGIAPYMEETNVVSGSFLPMLGGVLAKQGITDAHNPVYEGKKTFSEVWTPVVKQWAELSKTGVMPKEVVGLSGDQVKQQFIQGKLAMYRSGPWDFPDLHKAGVNFGVAPYPAVEGGQPFIGGGPDSPYCISSKISGAKLKAAEKFLAFINSPEGLKILDEKMGQISSSTKYQAKVDPVMKDIYLNYMQKGKFFWSNWPKNEQMMSKTLSDKLQELILGKVTPEQVTKALDEKWKNS